MLISILSGLLLAGALVIILFLTPYEQIMGPVQKIFYFHVAAGWSGMASFLAATVFSINYITKREKRFDIMSEACVEVGLVFSLINILTGMIWARPIWGTWWTWDPRLTTVAIMGMVYLAYMLLRTALDDSEKQAKLAAVYAIIAFASVPFTFFSIRVFRGIHPVLIGSELVDNADLGLSENMLAAFFASLIAFSVLTITLIWYRYLLGLSQKEEKSLENDHA